jgi:hypothetical protein
LERCERGPSLRVSARIFLAAGIGLGLPGAALAAEDERSPQRSPSAYLAVAANPEKAQYTLFSPTPTELLRELSTDRPDRTESPYSVDAGRVQVEIDLYNYASEREGGRRDRREVDSFTVGGINAKIGLTSRADFQLVVDAYTSVRTRDRADGGGRSTQRGFGDLTTRLKYNVVGNDGGRLAVALLPFLTFPTSEDDLGTDGIEGGLIVPVAFELPAGFGLGLMTELDVIRDGADSGLHYEFINSITVNRELLGPLAGYVELFSRDSKEDGGDSESTLDVGFTYAIGSSVQLDAGINVGLTRESDDLNPFVGLTRRF